MSNKFHTSIPFLVLFSFLFIGADECGNGPVPKTGQSTVAEMEQTETNQSRLARMTPPPQLQDSQERRNLIRRLELVNNPNRISYIHLLAANGQLVFYSTVKGKVSSLNSLLTTPDQVVTLPCPGCGQYTANAQHVIRSPDFDGSYGENPQGVFWFSIDGVYMEWNGVYFISDRPMRLADEPLMVRTAPTDQAPANPVVAPPVPDAGVTLARDGGV